MRRDGFLIDSLSHFVRDDDGPPPGVPVRTESGFETRLAATCEYQRVTPIVSRSLDRLALPPSISAVTAARLRRHAHELRSQTTRALETLHRLTRALEGAGVPSLVCGEALSAACYAPPELRHVSAPELVIDEHDAATALAVLGREGFEYPGTHPVFGPRRGTGRISRRRATELVAFHHYFAPLVLKGGSTQAVRLRFRLPDVGHPRQRESAWDRRGRVVIAGHEFDAIAFEDHLLDVAVVAGTTGLARLPWIVDIGRLVGPRGPRLDWDGFAARARVAGVYAAARYAIRHACRTASIADAARRTEPAALLSEPLADQWWRPDDIDYLQPPRRRAGRFRFGLAWQGGLGDRARWVWRHLTPPRRWVRNRVGASNPWRWLEFLLVVRDAVPWPPVEEPSGRVEGDNVRPFGLRPGSRP